MHDHEYAGRIDAVKQRAHGRWSEILASAGVDEQMKMACRRLEARGIAGFTRQDKLEMTFLDDVANDPCLKLGFKKKKPVAKR